jgi:hypothetical protein
MVSLVCSAAAALPQYFSIKLRGCILYLANQCSTLGKFARISGAKIEVSSRLEKMHGGKVLGDGDPQSTECLGEFMPIVELFDLSQILCRVPDAAHRSCGSAIADRK